MTSGILVSAGLVGASVGTMGLGGYPVSPLAGCLADHIKYPYVEAPADGVSCRSDWTGA